MCSLGHRLIVNHPVGMECPGLRPPRIRGRGDRVPPRKSPIPGPFPARPFRLGAFIPRRGGLCTPAKEAQRQSQMLPRFGHQLLVKPPMTKQCLAIRPAVPCGRAERVPPPQPPFGSSTSPTPLGDPCPAPPPAEGRAPHARNEGIGFKEDLPR
jgi:hypothetical protein